MLFFVYDHLYLFQMFVSSTGPVTQLQVGDIHDNVYPPALDDDKQQILVSISRSIKQYCDSFEIHLAIIIFIFIIGRSLSCYRSIIESTTNYF